MLIGYFFLITLIDPMPIGISISLILLMIGIVGFKDKFRLLEKD